MVGGLVEPYQDEPLAAVHNSDSDKSDWEEGEASRDFSCHVVNVLSAHAFFHNALTCGFLRWHRKLLKIVI